MNDDELREFVRAEIRRATPPNARTFLLPQFRGTVAEGKRVIFDIGTVALVISGAQTNTTTVPHGLGVVPQGVWMPSFYSDGGHFVCHVGYGGAMAAPDATNFRCFAWDRLAGAHGPGTLDPIPWIAYALE